MVGRLMAYKLINGDSAEVLKQYPDNHFDSGVCDPTYIEISRKRIEAWNKKDEPEQPKPEAFDELFEEE